MEHWIWIVEFQGVSQQEDHQLELQPQHVTHLVEEHWSAGDYKANAAEEMRMDLNEKL